MHSSTNPKPGKPVEEQTSPIDQNEGKTLIETRLSHYFPGQTSCAELQSRPWTSIMEKSPAGVQVDPSGSMRGLVCHWGLTVIGHALQSSMTTTAAAQDTA